MKIYLSLPSKSYALPIAFLSCFFIATLGCQKNASQSMHGQHIVTATMQESTKHLYYSATIQPLNTEAVLSPITGIITKTYFRYGNWVEKGRLLMSIHSTQSKQDYVTALTNYIKDKEQYIRNENSFEATTALYKAGIIDKESYLNEKAQLGSQQLAYLNSTEVLKEATKDIPGVKENLTMLTLDNAAAIQNILQTQLGEIKIYAPISGIVLLPEKGSGDSGGGKSGSLASEIKKDQPAVSIGNMQGLSASASISETDINQIKVGQMAILTINALPGVSFYGKVASVSRQASTNQSSGGLASFPIEITVPEINHFQRLLVRIGMTAKIDLPIKNPPQLKIPIKAIHKKKDGYIVNIINPQTGQPHEVAVTPGTTDVSQIVILKGLRAGDKVIVRD